MMHAHDHESSVAEHGVSTLVDAHAEAVEVAPEPKLYGLIAEFRDVGTVLAAARRVRDAGYRRWDVHSPFPIHGIEKAMGVRPTLLPWLVLAGGLTGMGLGLLLVWYTNAFDYPFLISGKPIFSLQANIPVIFEMTVLFSAFTAVFGMLLLNKLPMLYNPLFRSARFRRVTDDRFVIAVDATDPRFERETTEALLRSAGAIAVEEVEE